MELLLYYFNCIQTWRLDCNILAKELKKEAKDIIIKDDWIYLREAKEGNWNTGLKITEMWYYWKMFFPFIFKRFFFLNSSDYTKIFNNNKKNKDFK